jgi:YidC/Oxa1 family membrane protein insertase
MEKKSINWNTIIGTVLMVAIVAGYSYFNRPDEKSIDADTSVTATDNAQVVEETAELMEVDSVKASVVDSTKITEQYGPFVAQEGDKDERFTIENEILELEFSRRGAQLVAARLKDYRTWDSLPLYLIKESASHNLNLKAEGKSYNTAELMFTARPISKQAVEFTLTTASGAKLVYNYSLESKNYMLNWKVSSQGMSDMMSANTDLVWEMLALRHEKNLERETEKTNVEYFDSEENDLDDLSVMGEDEETVERIKWVAFKQQFFSTILLNRAGDFQQARIFSKAREGDEELTKRFLARVNVGGTGSEFNADMGLYLGPNKYDVLESYGYSFERVIPMGWGILGWINRGIIINVFNWLQGYGLNYGLIILIIALLIKLIIFPLTFTSYKSMAKMRVLKPEIDALNEKFKDKDAMQKQQATMELYRKAGVNPLGGCIPVLLQMPILIALFNFFPSSIELRQQSFLWATDLSTYDSIYNLPFDIPFYGDHVSLFTLLMTVSTLIYTYMNQQLTGQNQQFPQMKYIVYLMPVIFLGVFNNYAAGLSYYYFLSNMITFGQQFAIRSYIDEKKILAKMEKKKESPTKENRLMRRMRELQEQQEKGRKK